MTDTIRIQGRNLSRQDLQFIRQLIDENPLMSRRKLSIALCEAWDWRNARGMLKDMASRSLMLKLHERGEIRLPERKQKPSNKMVSRKIQAVDHSTETINQPLKTLTPVRIIKIQAKCPEEALYNHFLSAYHYLSYKSTVGENMKYLVLDNQDRPLACLLFGSSAWSCAARDVHLAWSPSERQRNINYTTNNTRFLILPWVKVPHLASHLLGKISRQIQSDWQARYGHSIHLLETFVDQSRYQGTCYKAANWLQVGETQGRSRNDKNHTLSVPIKSVLLYPLSKKYKTLLSTE